MPATSATMTPIRKAIVVEQDADGYRMGWRWCSHGILSGLVRDQEAAGEAIGEQDPQVCCGVGEATVSRDVQSGPWPGDQ